MFIFVKVIENVKFITCLWSLERFSFLITMSKKKINIKENFTFTRKNPQDQVTFK